MESWLCNPREKAVGLLDGIIPCTEVTRIKDTPTTCELESSCNNNSTILFSCQDVTESLTYRESCAGSTQKAFSVSFGELSDTTTHLQVKTASHSFSRKAASGEEETGSKSLSSVIDSDIKDSSIIDLKLGRISDCGYSKKSKPFRDAETHKSHASSITAKRIRSTSLNGQTSFCQVLNCNIDLSDSKDYYRRHRVCEVHSKTAVVIVNGIEQRFCQQCSRFHLLDAFDEGKRSCRKRLAGHNERRRKPQIDINSSRTARMTELFHGMAFLGTTSSGSTSFVSPYMFPHGILEGANYENATYLKQAQSREYTFSSNAPSPAIVDGQLLPRSLDAAYGTQKHLSYNAADTTTPNSIHFNRGKQHEVGFGASLLVFDNELHNKSLHMVPASTCAHSLLSYPQAEGSYSHQRAASLLGRPPLFQDGNIEYGKEHFLDKALAVEQQASSGVDSGGCYLSRMNNLRDQQTNILVSSSNNAEGFDVQSSGIFQGSRLVSNKDHLAHESGQTIDLLQLSSLLQDAEDRRRSVPDPFKPFPSL